MKLRFGSSLEIITTLFLAGSIIPSTHAADLTWDAGNTSNGATIDPLSGNWNTTAGNVVWNNAGTNVIWSQTSTTDGSNAAFFAGTDGTANQYVVTLAAQMAAESITFNNSGYQITGSTLALMPTTSTNGAITVAAGKTATINSALRYAHNVAASVVVGSGSVLNLGGGTTASNNPQFAFTGAGTVNITAGTYASNVGSIGNATFNQTGGTYNITPGSNAGFNITSATQNVAYNLSAGTLSVNGNASTATVNNSYLAIGNGTGSSTSTLHVSGTGTMNAGTTASRAGEIRIGNTSASNGTLNVSGGTVTVGTGSTTNQIYFFKAGAEASRSATMTQSGGTVTANGIQFGGSSGTYDAASSASLTLSGGSLYVGAQGITRGSGASALPVAIQLQGGTLGADQNWSSSLDMKLGGATIRAQDATSTNRDISLSGILSDETTGGSLTKTGGGMLTLSGANTYTGTTTLNGGSLTLGANNVLPDASAVVIGNATLNAATFADSAGSLDVTSVTATINLGLGATLAFADSSAIDWSGGTLNITGTFIPGSSLRFGTTSAGLTPAQLTSISAAGFSNFTLNENGYLTVIDSTPPTLSSIVDNKNGGPISAGTKVTYTLTFDEPMDASSIGATDFNNAGTGGFAIGAITAVSSTIFTLEVTNTTIGTLILQIPTTATIADAAGNLLDCDPALQDDSTLTVNNSPAPVLSQANIVDDKTGQPVGPNMLVTYTLTFSEDIDETTVTSADFGNAGTASSTFGTISEISPGVFTVQVTPTSIGTLRFMVNANAEIRSAISNNVLDTSSAILDAETITIGNYLFWDTVAGDGSNLTAGSGTWDLTAGNTIWNNGISNVIWSQTGITDASNAAIFDGTDGTADQYVITIGAAATMAAESVTFDSSGYLITGGNLALRPTTTTSGAITVAAGKTATINSAISYSNNEAAAITVAGTGVLNLGGGASNSQYNFSGAGTVNMTAGTYSANIGIAGVATINQTGGTFNVTPGSNVGYSINSATQNVAYNLSAGTLSVNGNASTATVNNSFLAIGNGTGSSTSTLNVSGTGTMNVGTTASRSGEIRIGNTSSSNGSLNVSGGAVTVGTGSNTNQIYFFKAGADASRSATMTQSGGTVTANGIQFGGSTGSAIYAATSTASLQLSGGTLYIGAAGITRGSDAASLATTIKLQGGTLGANQNWNSSLDIKLGTANIRAQDAGTTARNITLSGILSDDIGPGSLTKTGSGILTLSGPNANTYTGATTISAGTLDLGKVNAVSSSSSLTIANGAGLSLSTSSSSVPNLTFSGSGTLSFNVAGGHSLSVTEANGVANNGSAASVVINVTGTAPTNGIYTLITYNGALQGTGFSAFTLGSAPAGKFYALSDNGNAIQLVVSSLYSWTGAQSSEWSTAIIAEPKNWTKDGLTIDYANDLAVAFDNTATNKTVTITGANVSPLSVAFNSGEYILGGTHAISGSAPVTIASGATLKLGSSNLLPDGTGTGNITVDGVLDLNGFSDTINALSGTGSIDNSAAATTSTLTVGANSGGAFSGTLQNTVGTLALTKTGATDFILSGTNTYNGATTINQNRLFITTATAFSPNTAVTVNNGATFTLNASGSPIFPQTITLASGSNLSLRKTATLENVNLPASGIVKFNDDDVATQPMSLGGNVSLSGNLEVRIGGGTGTPGIVTLTGIFSGSSGSLIKTGPGQLSLGGANTFPGGITVKSGILEAKTSNTALGAGGVILGGSGSSGASLITGRALANPITINAPDSGSIIIGANGNGSGYTLSGSISLNGNLTLQTYNNPASETIKASSVISGGIIGSGNIVLDNNGLSGNTFLINTAAINHTGSLTLQGTATGTTTINAVVGPNVTGITQNSATSTLILAGANTYACHLTINAGTVRISNNSNTANDVSTVTIASNAVLNLTYSGTDTIGKLVVDGVELPPGVYGTSGTSIPQITGSGTLTVGAPEIAVEQPAASNIENSGTRSFGAVAVGSDTSLEFTIRNTGSGTLNLDATPRVSIGGTHAADFSVTLDPSASIAPGGTTTFSVRFAPSAAGSRIATLTITNNDSDEGTFTINLNGSGETGFGIWSSGAAFDQDANGDGVSNGLAWILGAADPSANSRALLPVLSRIGDNMVFTFKRNQESIGSGTVLTIEVGTTMTDWPGVYSVGADTAGSSPGVEIIKNSPTTGTDTVTLTLPSALDPAKFARLKAVQTP